MKKLEFGVPFSAFSVMDFLNCFASVYMVLEDMRGEDDYDCKARRGKKCDGCGNCHASTMKLQERTYFLFDTMTGRSSIRWRFDGVPTEMQKWIGELPDADCDTDETVEFCFGFAGYAYEKTTDVADFMKKIVASISAGRPVIAKVKAGIGQYRVISGYDDKKLISPPYTGAQQMPEGDLLLEDIESLLLIGEKVGPKYGLKDGLARIAKVMEYNLREDTWGGYIEKIGWHNPDGMMGKPVGEMQARMRRMSETMWHAFNSHNFAEVFRHCAHPALNDERFEAENDVIDRSYGYTHDLAWALIGLEECINWEKHYVFGFAEMAELTLSRIRQNDADVLAAVRSMIAKV